MKMVKRVLMLLAFLLLAGQTVNAQTWEEVTFSTPYNGEKTMKLLIEYAYGESDMKQVDGYWTTLELPKGRYNYIYSSDPSRETNWYPYYSLKNWRYPVKYVGYTHTETENFSFYFAGDLPEEYLNAIARVFETTYQGLRELYGIDLKTRYGLGKKSEVRIDVGWNGTIQWSMPGYIWLQYPNSDVLKKNLDQAGSKIYLELPTRYPTRPCFLG